MGLLFVLMLWGLFGCVVAIVGALVLRAIATALVGKVHNNPNGSARQRVIQFAMLLPFACLVWVGIIFVFQGFINSEFLHRDVGLGDEMYCPLPNGYSLSMIDDGEEGTVSSTKAQSSDESSSYQADGMSGVRGVQIVRAYILGAADSKYVEHFAQNDSSTDRYFAIDTRTGRRADFPNEDELRIAASRLGITLKLEPIFSAYRRYRFTWFDISMIFLLIVPPIFALGLLLRSAMRLHRTRDPIAPIGSPQDAT